MEYFILPKSIPVIQFAHSYTSDHYCIHHNAREDFLEITFMERGNSVRRFDNGDSFEIPQESITVTTFHSPCTTSSSETHQHCTIGISLKYDLVDKNTPGAIPLCEVVTSNEFVTKIGKILHSCVNDYLLYRDNPFKCSAYVLQIFSHYLDYYKEKLLFLDKPNTPSNITQYVKQVQDYVTVHIKEKITIDDIAKSVNLSCGYISNIFKQVCGISIIRYINEMKLQLIQDLTLNTPTTLAEASFMVGIDSPYYASRMFRKYYGTTLRNIKATKYK